MALSCPNPDCAFLRKHGFSPSYRAGTMTCSDCGAALVERGDGGGATTAAVPGASAPAAGARASSTPLVVTALVLIGSFVLGLVPLPFLDVELLRSWLASGGGDRVDAMQPVSLAALGIAPWITAALLVEIAAALVPRWRVLREPAGRHRLAAATNRLGVVVALAQALLLLRWIESIDAYGSPVLDDGSLGARGAVVASIVCGALLVRLGAHLIDARGVGGGMTLLVGMPLAVGLLRTLISLAQALRSEARSPGDLMSWWLVIGGAVAVTLLVRPFPDDDRPAQPVAGLLPLLWSAAALQAAETALPLFNVMPLSWELHQVVLAACAGVLTVGVGRVLHLRASTFGGAVPRSLAFVLALVALWAFAGWRSVVIDATGVVVLVCVGRDLAGELTARRMLGALGVAGTMPSLAAAHAAQVRLSAAGIGVHVRAAHHRALWHFFGPHLSLDVLVPAADVERAREHLSASQVSASRA
ncbi:MAG: hypothetical protein HYS27_17965 [Deltaproteobacteria bacterium]|nr:hypothetical protein [Deltaproteobacteria bacterium]